MASKKAAKKGKKTGKKVGKKSHRTTVKKKNGHHHVPDRRPRPIPK
jgi:hypothetical protein